MKTPVKEFLKNLKIIKVFSKDDASPNERKGSPVWYNKKKAVNVNKSINSNRRPHDQVFSQKFFWLREKMFDSISQKTLVSLFPFFLFSGIIRVIALSVFSDRGYIHQLFSMDSWLPWDQAISQVLINFSNFLGGLAGPLATYFAGKYTAGHYGRSTGTAGVTALLVSLIVGSQELLVRPLNDGNWRVSTYLRRPISS